MDTVISLASEKGTGAADVAATGRLLAPAEHAGVRHVVSISIIGRDRIQLPCYAFRSVGTRRSRSLSVGRQHARR